MSREIGISRFPGLVILGSVRGAVKEAERVVRVLEGTDPYRIALDLSPEELSGLKEQFSQAFSEPLVPLLDSERALAGALSIFGEVRLPSPAFVVAVRWAEERGRELLPLDPDELCYSDLFLKHVGYLDLVRHTLAERSLSRSPPKAESAEELVIRWDGRLQQAKGFQHLLAARRSFTAGKLKEALSRAGERPVVAIVDHEHVELISTELQRLLS